MECSGPATVVFDKSLTEYDFGPLHPMSPLRVDLTIRLAEVVVVLDRLRVVPAPMATHEQVASVHDEALIESVTKAGTIPGWTDEARGLGTDDDPVFRDMHVAAAHVVGASVEAFRQVWSGESLHAVNIAGRRSSTPAPSGWRPSTSTCTTATAWRRSSTTTRGC